MSPFDAVIGDSPNIRRSVELAERIARSGVPHVLITGEAGTGKELFARCIHARSPTSSEPFVALTCGGLPEALLETELFGEPRRDGSAEGRQGLFEMVGAGTVLLKEVNELSVSLQAQLIRLLDARNVRRAGTVVEVPIACRILAATKVPLEQCVTAGTFSEELLSRFSTVRLDLPPLRERDDDARMIAEALLAAMHAAHGGERKHLSIDAGEVLRGHRWPGNVRELRQVIDRASVLARTGLIMAADMPIQQRRAVAGFRAVDETIDIRIPAAGRRLVDVERELLEMTMRLANYNQSAAARTLGISRPTLLRKLRAFGLVTEAAVRV